MGDYVSGPNHTLPTSGLAKIRGGLSVMDFVKIVTIQEYTKAGVKKLGPAAVALAEAEGLKGHAEAVRVTFDPKVISYEDILRIFFTVHDPTTLNRQGNDVGTQYRSVIFYHNENQKKTAEMVMKEIALKKIWDDPIVTELQPFKAFYEAEKYHQEYFANNPNQGYCRVVIAPKVAKFRSHFADRLKK